MEIKRRTRIANLSLSSKNFSLQLRIFPVASTKNPFARIQTRSLFDSTEWLSQCHHKRSGIEFSGAREGGGRSSGARITRGGKREINFSPVKPADDDDDGGGYVFSSRVVCASLHLPLHPLCAEEEFPGSSERKNNKTRRERNKSSIAFNVAT